MIPMYCKFFLWVQTIYQAGYCHCPSSLDVDWGVMFDHLDPGTNLSCLSVLLFLHITNGHVIKILFNFLGQNSKIEKLIV